MDVERSQPERHIWLEFGRESLLGHVVTALHEQVVERVQINLRQIGRRCGHERNPEQAAQFMGTRPRGNLCRDELIIGVSV